jgi:hypothetical protein
MSIARRSTFDNAETRLHSREWHVVGHNRLGETLQGERANLFGCDASLQRDIDALTEQNLAVLGFSAEPGSNIAHGTDRRVARALGEADLAQRCVALRDTDPEAEVAATLAPGGDQRAGGSRIAIAMLTARSAGSGQGTGSLKNTMMPSPENWSRVPSN